MKVIAGFLVSLAVLMGGLSGVAGARDKAPLFINLTSDDAHRAGMGLMSGKNQLERGHKLTVFLNDRAVNLGSKANAARFGEHRKTLAELTGKGATGGALFEPHARSLTG